MTPKNDTIMIRPPVRPGTGNQPIDYRVVSVLLVFSNPVVSDRICHQLERNENVTVETCLSEDDAIRLLEYIRFDVILVGYTTTMPDRFQFLKALRAMYPSIPVIYYPLLRDSLARQENLVSGPVYFVDWQNPDTGNKPDDLYPVIMQALGDNGSW